jgi:hypothetical protein
MATNSLGQFIVNESGSSVVSIKITEQYISLDQYNRFLLDNKEFTELTPTIDKDALIKSLTNQVDSLNGTINNLTTDLKGGFLVSVATPQYSFPVIQPNAITYNGKKVWESIGFDNDNGATNFNSRQSNGLKFWSIPNKEATIYKNSNSLGNYDLKATIKYRFKYIGTQPIDNIQSVNNTIQFYQIIVDDNGQQRPAQQLSSIGQIINQTNKLTKTTYNTGDVTQEFSANLVRDNYTLGENTDVIYLPVQYYFNQLISPNSISTKTVRDNFLMEILPDSTFSLLPR